MAIPDEALVALAAGAPIRAALRDARVSRTILCRNREVT